MTTAAVSRQVGPLLRDWRMRRRLSQLELALEAGVSPRHLSFVETSRSRPSAQMVLLLAEKLEVPLRDRNQLLMATGYAPVYGERPLDSAEMTSVREAVMQVLRAHEPYPAVVVDRSWNLVAGNRGVELLTRGMPAALLTPPVNVLRLSLHPDGMAPNIANLAEWRAHLLDRLGRQAAVTGDETIRALHAELCGYSAAGEEAPGPPGSDPRAGHGIAVPLRLRVGGAELSFLSTVTTFGTPVDITLAELAIESFFPADQPTANLLLRDHVPWAGDAEGRKALRPQ